MPRPSPRPAPAAIATRALLAATLALAGASTAARADTPPRDELVAALSGVEHAPELPTVRAWGADAAPALVAIADDAAAPPYVRTRALYALRAFPNDTAARDYLRVVANDAARPLLFRRAAFDALAEGFADVPTLARWLHAPAVDVRDGAAWALARVRTPAATAALRAALQRETDETVRTTLRTALARR